MTIGLRRRLRPKSARLVRQILQSALTAGLDCAIDEVVGRLLRRLRSDLDVDGVRTVQDHFAVLGRNLGRLIVDFVSRHIRRNAAGRGSVPDAPPSLRAMVLVSRSTGKAAD